MEFLLAFDWKEPQIVLLIFNLFILLLIFLLLMKTNLSRKAIRKAVASVIPPEPEDKMLPLLQQLEKDFETKLKYDASKQEQVDKLYKENMDYKSGILKKFQQSLILAVIEKIDEAEKDIGFFSDKEFSEENYRKLLTYYQDTAASFQDMLQQQFDVVMFRSEPDMPFDAKRQKTLKTVPTDDPAKHKTVKKTLRPGYELDGQVLRAEMVEVYVKQ